MGLLAFYKTKEEIPEAAQSFYVEKDGLFLLDVDAVDGMGLADTTKLKTALSKERDRATAAEKLAKKFEGIEDPAAAIAAVKKLEELGDLDSIEDLSEKHKKQVELAQTQAKEAFDREKLKLETKHATDVKGLQENLTGTEGQLRKEMVTNAAMRAIEKSGGSKSTVLLLPYIGSRTKVERGEDGKHIMQMMDDAGNVMTTAALGSVEDMGMDEFVDTLKTQTQFAHAFEANPASGSGAGGKGSGASGAGVTGRGSGGGANTVQFKRGEISKPEVFAAYKAARTAQDAGKGPVVEMID